MYFPSSFLIFLVLKLSFEVDASVGFLLLENETEGKEGKGELARSFDGFDPSLARCEGTYSKGLDLGGGA